MNLIKIIAFLSIIQVTSAFAFPQAPVDDLNFRPSYKDSFTNSGYDYEGIVKLSNCSGSLVKFVGQSTNALAVVMTNGHCVSKGFFGGFIGPGEVIVNKKVNTKMKVFKDKKTLHNITATKLIYATMTDTDIAFYELNETYAQILARTGVNALNLSAQRPVEGTNIEIVSGYWERGYSCGIDAFVFMLREGNWTFTDSLRYTSGCDTVGGTSGSPIVAAGTREVIAINNTANESGRKCTQNNPCEVDEFGNVEVKRGMRYGQQSYKLYGCLNNKFELDLNLQGCILPK